MVHCSREVSPTSYTPGELINVTVTLLGEGAERVLALGYQEYIPDGWTLESRVDNGPFTVYRQVNNVLEYASLQILTESSFPVSFSYSLRTSYY